MDISQLEQQLQDEGYAHVYVWRDEPYTLYADHTHQTKTAHVILQGEMTLTSEGNTHIYAAGERVDVPANTVHSAQMGAEGCKYLIGEK